MMLYIRLFSDISCILLYVLFIHYERSGGNAVTRTVFTITLIWQNQQSTESWITCPRIKQGGKRRGKLVSEQQRPTSKRKWPKNCYLQYQIERTDVTNILTLISIKSWSQSQVEMNNSKTKFIKENDILINVYTTPLTISDNITFCHVIVPVQ